MMHIHAARPKLQLANLHKRGVGHDLFTDGRNQQVMPVTRLYLYLPLGNGAAIAMMFGKAVDHLQNKW
jgi:hypothetical protein